MLNQIIKNKENINKRITILEERSEYDNTGFINLSIDDTIEIFEDINKNKDVYESIFNNKILKQFKDLHEQYGLKVTFYCYYENDEFNLSQMTDKYKQEFRQNSDWMKFGFHAYNENTYENATYNQTLEEYEQTIEQLINIVGSESIDYIIRLGYFKASNEAINALIASTYPIQGLLCSDDGRISYNLTVEQQKELDNKEYIFLNLDREIVYLKTDFRLDNLEENEIKNKMKEQTNFEKGTAIEIIFTHEWLLKKDMFNKIELVCQIAKAYGYCFEFIPEDELK